MWAGPGRLGGLGSGSGHTFAVHCRPHHRKPGEEAQLGATRACPAYGGAQISPIPHAARRVAHQCSEEVTAGMAEAWAASTVGPLPPTRTRKDTLNLLTGVKPVRLIRAQFHRGGQPRGGKLRARERLPLGPERSAGGDKRGGVRRDGRPTLKSTQK